MNRMDPCSYNRILFEKSQGNRNLIQYKMCNTKMFGFGLSYASSELRMIYIVFKQLTEQHSLK